MSSMRNAIGVFFGVLVLVGLSLNSARGKETKPSLFKIREGVWEATIRTPDGGVSTGVHKFETVVDGRFQTASFEGEFQGEVFSSHAVLAHEPEKDRFVTYYFDATSTAAQLSVGRFDEKARVFTVWNNVDGTDEESWKTARFKTIFRFPTKAKMIMEVFEVRSGEDDVLLLSCDAKRVSGERG